MTTTKSADILGVIEQFQGKRIGVAVQTIFMASRKCDDGFSNCLYSKIGMKGSITNIPRRSCDGTKHFTLEALNDLVE